MNLSRYTTDIDVWYNIMQRDGHRCSVCKASGKDVKLVVGRKDLKPMKKPLALEELVLF